MSGTEDRAARVVPAKAASEHRTERTSRCVNEERSAPTNARAAIAARPMTAGQAETASGAAKMDT